MSGGELVAGAIYDPRQDEMYSAATGQGATLNGKPIRVSPVTGLRAGAAGDRVPAGPGLPGAEPALVAVFA